MAESLDNKAISTLRRIVRAAQREIAKNAAHSVMSATASEHSWQRRLEAIEKLYKIINTVFSSFAESEIPKSYKDQLIKTKKTFNEVGRRAISSPRTNVANELIIDSIVKMGRATRAGLDEIQRLFRSAQQAVISDVKISELLAQGIMTNNTPDNLKKVLKSELYKKIVNDEKIIVINDRSYRADKYSELVARTRTREAQTNAIVETVRSFGEDSVTVSIHGTDCDVCSQFEGRTYSISGVNSQHPPLTDRPPFHPNCLHVLVPEV